MVWVVVDFIESPSSNPPATGRNTFH